MANHKNNVIFALILVLLTMCANSSNAEEDLVDGVYLVLRYGWQPGEVQQVTRSEVFRAARFNFDCPEAPKSIIYCVLPDSALFTLKLMQLPEMETHDCGHTRVYVILPEEGSGVLHDLHKSNEWSRIALVLGGEIVQAMPLKAFISLEKISIPCCAEDLCDSLLAVLKTKLISLPEKR